MGYNGLLKLSFPDQPSRSYGQGGRRRAQHGYGQSSYQSASESRYESEGSYGSGSHGQQDESYGGYGSQSSRQTGGYGGQSSYGSTSRGYTMQGLYPYGYYSSGSYMSSQHSHDYDDYGDTSSRRSGDEGREDFYGSGTGYDRQVPHASTSGSASSRSTEAPYTSQQSADEPVSII